MKELIGAATRDIRVFFAAEIHSETSLGHAVSKVIVHRNILLSRPWADDIALVKLANSNQLPNGVGSICLPRQDTDDT